VVQFKQNKNQSSKLISADTLSVWFYSEFCCGVITVKPPFTASLWSSEFEHRAEENLK
jgi:hypothetical protein